MSDDYLWDGTGKADPEVQRLEKLLREVRYQPASRRFTAPRTYRALPLVAAAILLAVVGLAVYRALRPLGSVSITHYHEGEPLPSAQSQLYEGGWLETDAHSHAQIAIASLGEVNVAPSSKLKLVTARLTQQRLELARGQIHARISAPPRLFIVDTPSATAVDLGCEYALTVADSGAALLHVTFGYVELTGRGKTALVPAGTLCETRPGHGPGIPYAEDAPKALRTALARMDTEGDDAAALEVVLDIARRADAVTLWHLLPRVDRVARQRVALRLMALVPLPKGVSESDILRLKKSALDQWWDEISAS